MREVREEIDAYNYRIRTQATMDYQLANLIGISVGRLFSKQTTYPEFEEVYGFLFTEEDMKKLQKEKEEQEKQKQIANFRALIEQHNAKFKQ